MKMQFVVPNSVFCLALSRLIVPFAAHAQSQVLGEVKLVGKTKADKTSGVWVDGQYIGYVMELKDDKKLLLMPGEHEIAVRQAGYTDFTKKVVVEPHKKTEVQVVMLKDPRTRLPTVTSLIKLKVTPERAAVFVDDAFARTGKSAKRVDIRCAGDATFREDGSDVPRGSNVECGMGRVNIGRYSNALQMCDLGRGALFDGDVLAIRYG